MKLRTKLLVSTILLFTFGTVVGLYNLSVSSDASQKQKAPFFVLQSSEKDGLNIPFVNSLTFASSKDDKSVYLFRRDTQEIVVINANRNARQAKSSHFPSAKTFAVNSQGRIFVAGDSQLSVSDDKGNRLKNFSIPSATDSIAALDGGIVIAAADSGGLMTVFDESGTATRRIGNLKKLDAQDVAQNLFLNDGDVTVNESGEIYYASISSPAPSVQKFSKDGTLLKEFAVEGATVDLQLKRANEYLKERSSGCVGGFYVIRTATVDPTTGNLWIGINGLSAGGAMRRESGVLYEYTSNGEKISEYALTIPSSSEDANIITDVKDLAVSFPNAYLLTSYGKVYHFDLNQRSAITPKEPETKELSFASFFRMVAAAFSPTVSAQLPCPSATNYSCTPPCGLGYEPQTADCGALLRSFVDSGLDSL